MITGSTTAGKASVYCYNFASPLFSGIGGGLSEGRNTLQNGYYGIAADYYSTPSAGASDIAFNNRFINNSYANAYANYNSVIYARYDWWGSSTPDPNKIIAVSGSTIYWNPYLTSDPGPSRNILSSPNSNDKVLATGLSFSMSNSGLQNNNEVQQVVVIDDLLRARELRFKKNYQEAVNIYKSILASRGETTEAKIALAELGNTYSETKDVQIFEFIKSFIHVKNDLYGLKPIALEVLSKVYGDEKNIKDAIEINNKLINDYPDKVHERNGKMNLFFIYYNSGKLDLAKEMLSSVKTDYESNEEIKAAEWLLGLADVDKNDLPKFSKVSSLSQSRILKESPNDYQLFDNYPNPFNPATKISFSLPEAEHVKLIVFDVNGREVTQLLNEFLNAGRHSVTFDASNLSSGVYFYRIQAGKFLKTRPMILLK